MSRRKLPSALARLIAAWGGLTWIACGIGPGLIMMVHSPVEFMVEELMPGYVTSMSAPMPHEGSGDIAISVRAFRPVAIAGDYQVAAGIPMSESIDAGHDLVPAILLLSVLAAWPHRGFRKGLWSFGWGALSCLPLLIWTVSVHIAGLFEINLQRVASACHLVREKPWFLSQFIFFESGGSWLIALLLATAIAMSVNSRPR